MGLRRFTRRRFRWAGLLFLSLLAILSTSAGSSSPDFQSQPASPANEAAYFIFSIPPAPETFTILATDPAFIAEARAILADQAPSRHISGTILKAPASYNPPWSYHLDPASLAFFSASIEVCDASILYVEHNLAQVCDSLLPACRWCPWNSHLQAEIPAPVWVRVYIPILFNAYP